MCQALPGAGVTAEKRECEMEWEMRRLTVQVAAGLVGELAQPSRCVSLISGGLWARNSQDRSFCHYS